MNELLQRVPRDARRAARVLVMSADQCLLLFKGVDADGNNWWVTPGGGLQAGETFEAAAARELYEETGRSVPIGPCVWTRRHRHVWYGSLHEQYERFFVVRAGSRFIPTPRRKDSYIVDDRWWALDEIRASTDDFAPGRLADLLPPILRGQYPSTPIDAGV